MTTREFAASSSSRWRSTGGWGAAGDLSGLAVVTALVTTQIPVRHALLFLYFLAGSGLLTWMVVRQVQPRLPGLVRSGYRFISVPVVAAVIALTLSAIFRAYYSRAAIAEYAVLWTLWIAVGRYSMRRFSSGIRILYAGEGDVGQELKQQSRIALEHVRTPSMQYRVADLCVVESELWGNPAWRRWLLHLEMTGIPLMSAERARETLTGRVPVGMLDAVWAQGAFNDHSAYLRVKRALDVILVVLASPVILFLSAVVAVVVLLDAGRPVIFSQLRIGRDNLPFRIYKFRTMRPDAEDFGPAFATERDPRVTRIGAFLRKFRLDELPQFLNVLRGDMSIIGPRPEQLGFAREYEGGIPLYAFRHGIRPGITGWAQVTQGYAAGDQESRTKLELRPLLHQELLAVLGLAGGREDRADRTVRFRIEMSPHTPKTSARGMKCAQP